ncbi:eukaryotic type KH-domain (KH-domain type I) [Gorgonomyces haynaldii]|nr:eukaryotic type KH-domain (KH-domain type I) [Gorgonomyces haynaldii]
MLASTPNGQPTFPHAIDDDPMVRLTGLTLNPELVSNHPHDLEEGPEMTLRALVTSKEAGIIIGRNGTSVTHVRSATGVRIGVSAAIEGVLERTLTMSGPLASVSKAFAMVAKLILDNSQTNIPSDTTIIRLLIAHQLVGSIIGKQGAKIRDIQDLSGTTIIVSKEMLPESTERVVEVVGSVDGIHRAIYHIGNAVFQDLERVPETIPYDPKQAKKNGLTAFSFTRSMRNVDKRRLPSEDGLETKNITVPAELVGSIIGKAGAYINTIRRTSGARLHIAAQMEDRIDRDITINGSPEQVERALDMIYSQLDAERQRRTNLKAEDELVR